jgi:GNAT superfamily N-acetyltransferase
MSHRTATNQIQLGGPTSSEKAKTSNGLEIEIRLASASDADTLAKFRYDFRSSLHQVVEDPGPFIERCTLWMQERLRSRESWRCWVAESKQTTVGNVWAHLIEKIPNPVAEPEYYIYLTNFYVREEFRDSGIGGTLLSMVIAWSKTKHAQMVILRPTQRSRPVYVRHGFTNADDLMQLVIESQ